MVSPELRKGEILKRKSQRPPADPGVYPLLINGIKSELSIIVF